MDKSRYHPLLSVLAILSYGSLMTGCATVRVARPDHWTPDVAPRDGWVAANNAYVVSSPATSLNRKTVWVSGWGWNQRNVDPCDCLGEGLAEVRASTNIGFELISVLTLGYFQPITIEWRCAKQAQPASKDF
jgi:hypothetical protein